MEMLSSLDVGTFGEAILPQACNGASWLWCGKFVEVGGDGDGV